MSDIYFADTHTLVIKDVRGDKRTVDLNNGYQIKYLPGDPFPEIYLEPYWYS